MAVDMFIKIEGVTGEAQDGVHAGEVDVLSWSWSCSQSGTTHMGAGSGAGKVSVSDLTLTKWIDKASPALLQACCSGKHFASATLTIRKAGGTPLEYLVINLTDVLVASYSTGGSGGEDKLTENVTLNFGQVKFTYTPQKEDGTKDAAIPVTWNIPKNSAS